MPLFIGFALLGVGLYAGYRWFAQASEEIASEAKRAEADMLRGRQGKPLEKDLGVLEYDPATGVYRPANRRNS
jgi:hypothetical protein